MIELILAALTQILWFLFGSETAALTTVGLTISWILFHKSGAGRYVYPWLLSTSFKITWWIVRATGRFSGKAILAISKKAVQSCRHWNFGAKPVNASRSTTQVKTTNPQPVQSVELSSTDEGWVVRTLKSMGFSTAEAQAAANTSEVAAASTLDDQVHAALVNLNPLTANR